MNRKEYERDELHKTIWKIANELRGSVDGWDFKQYVLGLLFYRFISENIENYVNDNQRKAGIADFEYRNISDEEALLGKNQILEEKGFFILPSELFCNVKKGADKNENLNVVISNIFNNIEASARGTASENDVKGLFDDFTIDNKLGNTVDERNEKLVRLLNAIGNLNFGEYTDNNIDLFGDAYEFLMTMYASSAGKSGGEFFTPQEVGELLARIVIMDKTSVNKVYDPACGSGGLLLKFAKILGKENVREGFFGQEINLTTYNLARINMFLHNINYNNFSIERGDTLIHPAHWNDEPFDAIVSNPPYSINWVGKENPILINDERFAPAGVLAPRKYADLAFAMHILSWLSQKGTAAIVEYPGVLHRKGAEEKIRKYFIDNNFIDTIIQLPKDLFYGVDIATCIIVFKKNKKENNVLFVDASNEFIRSGIKNKLSNDNINYIVDIIKNRKTIENKSILVSNEEISHKKYDLAINNYLDSSTIYEKNQKNTNIDLSLIDEIVNKQGDLRKEINNVMKNKIHDKNAIKYCLKDITTFMNGKGHEKIIDLNGKYIVVNSKFISTNGKVIKYTNTQLSPLYKDDILLVMSDLPNGKALAKTFYVDKDDKYTLNQRVCKLTVKDKNLVLPKYLYYVLNRNKQLLKYDNGTDQTNLRKDDILNIDIYIPKVTTQIEIISIMDKFSELEKELEKELEMRKIQCDLYYNKIFEFEELNTSV